MSTPCDHPGPCRAVIDVVKRGPAFEKATDTSTDVTLMKCTRPRVCAVCSETVTASIVLPEDSAVCETCTTIALRLMIVERAAVMGAGSGAFKSNPNRR